MSTYPNPGKYDPGRYRNPAFASRAVTPSDTVALARGPCSALYVGVGGDVTIVDLEGTTTTYPSVPAGAVLPAMAVIVKATGTAASGIVAMYN